MEDKLAISNSDPNWDNRVSKELPSDSPLRCVAKDILDEVSLETLSSWLDNVQFQRAYPICGFPHRDTTKSKKIMICPNRAGLNTKHPDEGRCLVHEFPEQMLRTAYARQLMGFASIQEIFEEISNRQENVKDLSQEITMARTILAANLAELKPNKTGKNDAIYQMILKAIEQIRKTADTIASIEEKEARGLTMESITGFLWHLHRILDDELLVPELKARIFDRISQECVFLAPKM